MLCWGDNEGGELGNGSAGPAPDKLPMPVMGLSSGVAGVGAGDIHTCAIVKGAAMCWGSNTHGQLGNNSTTSSSVPVQVAGLTSGPPAPLAGSRRYTRRDDTKR